MQTPATMLLNEKTILPPEGGWKERTYYVVDVAYQPTNIIHKSIFYTGFLNGQKSTPGGYNQIWNPTSDEKTTYLDAYYLKFISEIPDMKEQP